MSNHKEEWKEKLEGIKKKMPKGTVVVKEDVEQKGPFKNPPKKPKKAKKAEVVEKEDPNKNHLVYEPKQVDFAYDAAKSEEEFEVDDPAFTIYEQIKSGERTPDDLSVDEKFVLIRHLRQDMHMTQDQVASELRVTRRTVVNYDRRIKEYQAKKLHDETVWSLGGEAYTLCMDAAKQALKGGKSKAVAEILEKMISMLQSLGLLYREPAASKQAIMQQIKKDVTVTGVQQYQEKVQGDLSLENVLSELMEGIEQGKLEEGHGKDDSKNNSEQG